MYNIKLPFAYSDFTVHMQSLLLPGSFVGTKAGFSHDVPFFSHASRFELTLLALCASESSVISIIFEQDIHRFSK